MNAISYPFTIGVVGEVSSTTSIGKIYIDRMLTLLSTNINQRPMLQNYGTDMASSLFENENNFEAAVRQAITKATAVWIPEISIREIKFGVLNDGQYPISITIALPNETITTLSVSTAIFNYDGTITR